MTTFKVNSFPLIYLITCTGRYSEQDRAKPFPLGCLSTCTGGHSVQLKPGTPTACVLITMFYRKIKGDPGDFSPRSLLIT